MRKWKYFCPKGIMVIMWELWWRGKIFWLVLYDIDLRILLSPSWLRRWLPPDFPLQFPLHSFSARHACTCCPLRWMLSVLIIHYLTTASLAPNTCSNGNMSPASLLCWVDSLVCSLCRLVCLLAMGQAVLLLPSEPERSRWKLSLP